MKLNKLKFLLIAACCVVATLWGEIQGMETNLDFNLELAREAREIVKKFTVLNKPTQCEMHFKPTTEAQGFQIVAKPSNNTDIVMVISPPDETWENIPHHFDLLYQDINQKCNNIIKNELDCLKNIVLSYGLSNTEEQYLSSLLKYRIAEDILNYYRCGNCGELIAYSTFFLLKERNKKELKFNLEVIQLTSSLLKPCDGQPFTHVIGVIGRKGGSHLWPPSSWGENAVVYDSWNNAKYFSAKEMMDRDYYKYGEWSSAIIGASFNILEEGTYSDVFRSYEKYILETKIPREVAVNYIESHKP